MPPTREQIDAMRNNKGDYVLVNFRENAWEPLQVPITETTNVGELLAFIAKNKELEQLTKYGVLEIPDFGEARSLEKDEIVLDVQKNWSKPQARPRTPRCPSRFASYVPPRSARVPRPSTARPRRLRA